MITRIMIDLDGVLCDVQQQITNDYFGSPQQMKDFWIPGVYDLDKIFGREISLEKSFGWWATLPKTKECDKIIKMCQCCIHHIDLISTAIDGNANEGKEKWIKDNLRHFNLSWAIYAKSSERTRFANPETLLIDDCDQNIKDFREKGGLAITLPRLWNKYHFMAHAPCCFLAAALIMLFPDRENEIMEVLNELEA